MYVLRLYRRVLGLLAPERRLAITLALANAALAATRLGDSIKLVAERLR